MIIGFIGGGNMTEGIIKGLLKSGATGAGEIYVNDVSESRTDYLKKTYGVKIAGKDKISAESDLIVLAVRPQDAAKVSEELKDITKNGQIIVSICAGIKIPTLKSLLGDNKKYARIMPNTMTELRRGYSALAFEDGRFNESEQELVKTITDAIGKTLLLDESQFDAFTALSCAGPEWFILFATALVDGGVKIGLSREVSRAIVYENMEATGRLLSENDKHPYEITDDMNTPGGIGIAGYHSFQNSGLNGAVMDAVYAAYKRTTELG